MSLAPRLDLRQSQSLVMTPQLQQAIKLLALSNLEVEASSPRRSRRTRCSRRGRRR
jgi:DNA-directed RNA polymerase specialized sigma54-like protein